ncbi:MAG: hypothetical protein KDD67_15795 [Ignavibacteriae bacterium]|nr:hypothetical protein [Ignavibacteriota bacterium]MCB9215715.1 hypothetical protein [Ignavibacteria bacterium]
MRQDIRHGHQATRQGYPSPAETTGSLPYSPRDAGAAKALDKMTEERREAGRTAPGADVR